MATWNPFLSRHQHGACRRSKRTEHVATLNPATATRFIHAAISPFSPSNIDRPLLPLDRDESQQHGRHWVQPPCRGQVLYHMIITNRSNQALDPDKYRRWPTSRPSDDFQC